MKVILSNQARKFLDRLYDKKQSEKLCQIIDYLQIDPVPYKEYDLEKMGGMESSYRLRKGDFRIVYSFNSETNTVYVIEITRREQAYR